MADLTPEALAELRRLVERSPKGRWKTWALDAMLDSDGTSNKDTARFIARFVGPRTFELDLACAAVNALPQLLDAAVALADTRATNARLMAEVQPLRDENARLRDALDMLLACAVDHEPGGAKHLTAAIAQARAALEGNHG